MGRRFKLCYFALRKVLAAASYQPRMQAAQQVQRIRCAVIGRIAGSRDLWSYLGHQFLKLGVIKHVVLEAGLARLDMQLFHVLPALGKIVFVDADMHSAAMFVLAVDSGFLLQFDSEIVPQDG